ncbi:3-dehydroquinate synthase [Buchnera aphidicola]|uniref:3-dehydroquinate synthase n=1 Tax=Buchnera aphidicola subsp. Cinara cedri (strain Cc) TaxID=372461 RepID=AROB_BUCCC|nr:3-dehydroquinate synthase [Buchnera aphidicola]Q056Z3.1 RecName: Full=3-dehydroquinate synthase; Short=DHQS [Buchnera aphidicola BCc]ABJ90806.1 3-dehydroquinate synthase [Buchnera aphidicola BCc]
MIETIHVNLNNYSYNIYIGEYIFNNMFISSIFLKNKNNVLITNKKIEKKILKNKNQYFYKILNKIHYFSINDGENYKNLYEVEKIISFLLNNLYGRDLNLIALGGGVIGDITGFVASIFQRGVNFFQIPTTLLSQVDASIGGKTGVNHILGKNMIGSFWQPKGVFIDIKFLSTLPKKELLSGIAEIIKYAIVFDKIFFIWLENNLFKVLNLQKKELLYCIKKCCELKVKIIENDEKEIGNRVFLNLGHSFAHAIETFTGYGKWLHGNAVSVGIIMSSYLSFYLKYLKKSELLNIINIFNNIGLPIIGPSTMLPLDYLKLMMRDKKVINKNLRLVIPVSIGKVKLISSIKENILLDSITACQERRFFS